MPDPAKHAPKPKTMESLGFEESWSPFRKHPNQQYFGKYQGTVVNNVDPYQEGRLIVNVPDVHGMLPGSWALPCVPLTDIGMGTFMRPRIGANVWVEFEQGDPQKPIWVGGFWGTGETPPMAKAANAVPPVNAVMTMESLTSGISVCDVPIPAVPMPATVMLRAGGYTATIAMTPAGVTTTAPIVTVIASTAVSVTAPTVTVNSPVVTVNGAAVTVNATAATVTAATAITLAAPTVNVAAATAFNVAAPTVNIAAATKFTVTAPNFVV
jgi:hypothetical protein